MRRSAREMKYKRNESLKTQKNMLENGTEIKNGNVNCPLGLEGGNLTTGRGKISLVFGLVTGSTGSETVRSPVAVLSPSDIHSWMSRAGSGGMGEWGGQGYSTPFM